MDTPNPTSKLILTIREFDENGNPLWFWPVYSRPALRLRK
jgi:hypothetical protein